MLTFGTDENLDSVGLISGPGAGRAESLLESAGAILRVLVLDDTLGVRDIDFPGNNDKLARDLSKSCSIGEAGAEGSGVMARLKVAGVGLDSFLKSFVE